MTQRGRSRIHLRPRPLDRSDSWCWPGWNSSAHFIIKGWAASSLSPAIDVSYIRHKIRLTLRLPTPTLLVEQGFAGFFGGCDLHLFRSAATHRQPLCTMLFPRSPGFDSPPFVGQTLAETRCLQEPAPCSGYQAPRLSAPALLGKYRAASGFRVRAGPAAKRRLERAQQYRFPARRSWRSAAVGPQFMG